MLNMCRCYPFLVCIFLVACDLSQNNFDISKLPKSLGINTFSSTSSDLFVGIEFNVQTARDSLDLYSKIAANLTGTGYARCSELSPFWVKVKSKNEGSLQDHTQLVRIFRRKNEYDLITVAINQICDDSSATCNQIVMVQLNKYPKWLNEREGIINEICR